MIIFNIHLLSVISWFLFIITDIESVIICEKPQFRQILANKCGTTCADIAKPCTAPTSCIEVCVCPDNQVEQDGKCVSKAECRCTWNIDIFGSKPASQNSESPPDTKIQKECNECICKNGGWECTKNQCKQNCNWNEWENVGECSVTCGKGIQHMKRTKVEAIYGGKSCEGVETKSIPCYGSRKCCELNVEFYAANDNCEQTCDDKVQSRPSYSNCEEGCRCKTGFVRNYEKICTPASDCNKSCYVNGSIWLNGYSQMSYKKCKMEECVNGKVKDIELKDYMWPICSPDDIKSPRLGEFTMKDNKACCTFNAMKACRVIHELVTHVKLLGGTLCPLEKSSQYYRKICDGGCRSETVFSMSFEPQNMESLKASINLDLQGSNGYFLPRSYKTNTRGKTCVPTKYIFQSVKIVKCILRGFSGPLSVAVIEVEIDECGCK